MLKRFLLATLVATLFSSVPANAWEVRVQVMGSGVVDETTDANKMYCGASQNTPNWTVGATCTAGTPSGEYGQGWTVRYVATASMGWVFRRWESDGSTREAVKCDGANGSSTYTGAACQFGTFNNYQTRAVFEDITAPVPSITAGPAAGATTGRAVSFGFTATNNPGQTTSYTCRLTRGAIVVENWGPCASGKGYSSLEHGGHKFEVRATDPSGLTNLTERNWNVDATAPETTLHADGPAPNSLSKSRTATFQFTAGADATRYYCRIDRGPAVGTTGQCSSPYTTPALADGTYTFRVWAEDAVGNVESSHATRTWTIDATPPDTFLSGGPEQHSSTEARHATFELDANEMGVTYRCSLDGAPATECTSPHSVSGLGLGTHTLSVFAVDAAGNPDPEPATRTWSVVDVTAPETTLQADGPAENSLSKSRTATFRFTADGDATKYFCRIDRGPVLGTPAECESPFTTPELADGTYTFSVWAEDAAGNVESTHATRTWTIDATPPDTTLTGGPAAGSSTQATNADFVLGASEQSVTYRCSLDGSAATECASPHTISGLAAGEHTLSVFAVDAAGNQDPTPATRTWSVDLTAPETTLSGGPVEGASTTDTSATFGFASTEAGGFRCSLDGAAPADCTSPFALSGLAVGTHTLKVWARDAAGNEDATPATRSWTVVSDTGVIVNPPPPLKAAKNPARLAVGQKARRRHTTLTKLTLTGLPAGSSVSVRCRGRKCPARTFARTAGGALKLTKFLRRKLPVGTVLQITVTKPGFEGKRFTLKVRAGKKARLQTVRLA